jgi:two-component system chemotaxis sensor kinase CheA
MRPPDPAETFLQEADELLERIEETALEVTDGQGGSDAVNRLFRAFHTIKGSGAMFGFDAVASFTHHVESVLDHVREGQVEVTPELIQLILASKDHISSLLTSSRSGVSVSEESGRRLAADLGALLSCAADPAVEVQPLACPVAGPIHHDTESAAGDHGRFIIRFAPQPSILISGTNPLALLDELRSLGDCQVTACLDGIPHLEQLEPDQCHLRWEITLTTDRGIDAIKDVFIFVDDGAQVSIETDVSNREQPSLSAGSCVSRLSPVQTSVLPSAEAPSQPRKGPSQDATVRVPVERLDRLVNIVGELVMNQSRLTQISSAANVPNLSGPVEELARLVNELRDNVLGIRMMPIGPTFSRFKRLVHDLSAELGKEIDLMTEGGDTELDKTVLDQLGDPLVHLIRNSVDHGIESPDDRVRQGKPRRGTIRLAAAHVGSSVVITIADDGHGIDAAAVRAKAVQKGLLTAEARPSEQEIYELIFQPGFSTARQVTNVSGRGVGMDVVRRQFEALRGHISISSAAGLGTTFTLTLPLTLAIIDGLLVEIGRDQFILPMSVVSENVELSHAERGRNNGRNVIAVRGELVPYVRLRETFGIAESEPDIEKIVIARHGSDRVGLVVDRVLGNHQTVIQSVGRFYRDVDLVSGATIMGDGRVALILDLGGLVRSSDVHSDKTPAVAPLGSVSKFTDPTPAPGNRARLNANAL